MRDSRGFTLIELLIVVSIIGILAMIAIPGYVGQQRNATRTEAFKNLEAVRLLEEQFFSENAAYTGAAANAGAITALMPGFTPGNNMMFNYQVMSNVALDTPVGNPPTWGTAQNPCFTVSATGIAGTRVAGEVFAIDCNNIKNY